MLFHTVLGPNSYPLVVTVLTIEPTVNGLVTTDSKLLNTHEYLNKEKL